MEKPFHTVDETTKILPFGKSTLFEMIKRGEIRSVKVRGKRLIPTEAIRDFIQIANKA